MDDHRLMSGWVSVFFFSNGQSSQSSCILKLNYIYTYIMCNSYNHTVIDSVTTGSAPGKPTAFVLYKWSPGMDSFNPLCIYLLVGGFKHFFLCIIYRIILPIGVHIMKWLKPPTSLPGYGSKDTKKIQEIRLDGQSSTTNTTGSVPSATWSQIFFGTSCRKSSCQKNKNMVSGFDFPWNQSIDWLYILIL